MTIAAPPSQFKSSFTFFLSHEQWLHPYSDYSLCVLVITLVTVEEGFNTWWSHSCGRHVENNMFWMTVHQGKAMTVRSSLVFLAASSPPVPMGSHRGVPPFSHRGSLPHPKWCILDGLGSQLALCRHSPPGGPACLQQPIFFPQDRPFSRSDGFAQQCGEGYQVQR